MGELIPGRAAVLRLRGPLGALDLWCLYFPTGTSGVVVPHGSPANSDPDLPVRRQRADMRTRLASALSPSSSTLSVLMGDFIWVTQDDDRFTKSTAVVNGARDSAEERHFTSEVLARHNLHELYQPSPTHENAHARSRLDRIY